MNNTVSRFCHGSKGRRPHMYRRESISLYLDSRRHFPKMLIRRFSRLEFCTSNHPDWISPLGNFFHPEKDHFVQNSYSLWATTLPLNDQNFYLPRCTVPYVSGGPQPLLETDCRSTRCSGVGTLSFLDAWLCWCPRTFLGLETCFCVGLTVWLQLEDSGTRTWTRSTWRPDVLTLGDVATTKLNNSNITKLWFVIFCLCEL